MALMVVPCYQASVDPDNLQPYDRAIALDINQRLVSTLNPRPNLNIIWTLHERLQGYHECEDERKELYPCVAFVANVETL